MDRKTAFRLYAWSGFIEFMLGSAVGQFMILYIMQNITASGKGAVEAVGCGCSVLAATILCNRKNIVMARRYFFTITIFGIITEIVMAVMIVTNPLAAALANATALPLFGSITQGVCDDRLNKLFIRNSRTLILNHTKKLMRIGIGLGCLMVIIIDSVVVVTPHMIAIVGCIIGSMSLLVDYYVLRTLERVPVR